MLKISPTNAYKRDFKKIATELVGSSEYVEVMYCLINGLPLAEKYRDHALSGE